MVLHQYQRNAGNRVTWGKDHRESLRLRTNLINAVVGTTATEQFHLDDDFVRPDVQRRQGAELAKWRLLEENFAAGHVLNNKGSVSNITKEIIHTKKYINKKPFYMLHPDGWIVVLWEAIIILTTLWICIMLPLDLAFDEINGTLDNFSTVNAVIVSLLILDIFTRTLICGKDKKTGLLVTQWYKVTWLYITRHYFKIVVDIISAVPWLLVDRRIGLISMICLVKLYSKMSRTKERAFKPGYRTLWWLFSVEVIWMFLFVHWLSCGWMILTDADATDLTDSEIWDLYIDALYWCVTTVTTVGYGDITPTDSSTKIYTIFTMAIGVGYFAYLIGRIVDILGRSRRHVTEFEDKMHFLNAFFIHHKLPRGLQAQIWEYYKFRWETGASEDIFGDMTASLSPALATSVRLHESRAIFRNPKCFLSNEKINDTTRRFLANRMTRHSYLPGQLVYFVGEPAENLYIIEAGELSIRDAYDDKVLATLSTGTLFGYTDLVHYLHGGEERDRSSPQPIRSWNTVCNTHCTVFAIHRDDMRDAISFDEHLSEIVANEVTDLVSYLIHETFPDMVDGAVRPLAARATWSTFIPGSSLFLEGENVEEVYLIVSGSCCEVGPTPSDWEILKRGGSLERKGEPKLADTQKGNVNEKKKTRNPFRKKDHEESQSANDIQVEIPDSVNVYLYKGHLIGQNDIAARSTVRHSSGFSLSYSSILRFPAHEWKLFFEGVQEFRDSIRIANPVGSALKAASKWRHGDSFSDPNKKMTTEEIADHLTARTFIVEPSPMGRTEYCKAAVGVAQPKVKRPKSVAFGDSKSVLKKASSAPSVISMENVDSDRISIGSIDGKVLGHSSEGAQKKKRKKKKKKTAG